MKSITSILLLIICFTVGMNAASFEGSDAVLFTYDQLTVDEKAKNPELWLGVTENEQWLVMVDYYPMANWGHHVSYFYIQPAANNESLEVVKRTEEQQMPSIPMTRMYYDPDAAYRPYTFLRTTIEKRSVPIASHQYAII